MRGILSCLLLAGVLPGQQSITLEASRDTCIYADSGDLSSGRGPLTTGLTRAFGVRRTLVRFDVARVLPAGARITSAKLEMTMMQTKSRGRSTSLHRALADWGEGSSLSIGGAGARATAGDATWTWRDYRRERWKTVGGDFVAAPSATTIVDQASRYAWPSTANVVADVQRWLDSPQTAFGWFVLTDEQGVTAKLWASREDGSAARRPKLTLTFAVAPRVSILGRACVSTLRHFAEGLPRIGNAAFALVHEGGPANVPVFFALASRRAATPIRLGAHGCLLYLDPSSTWLAWSRVTTGGGRGRILLGVPSRSSLLGVELHSQSVVLAAQDRLDSANGLTIRLGG